MIVYLNNSYVGPYKYNDAENTIIVSSGYHPASELMIVTFLRVRPGVPLAVGAFCMKDNTPGSIAKIWGFPNTESNTLRASDFDFENEEDTEDIQRIISVYHITIDEKCNRVFFVDTGMLNYKDNESFDIQKSALWVLGLPENGCETRNFPLIRRIEMPEGITKKGKDGFMHVVLDYQTSGECDDLFLYITNTFFSYLVVYDYKNDEFWTINHEAFQPNENELVGNRGANHQSLKTIIDEKSGIMFYAEVQSNQIRCWNIHKLLNPDNIEVIYEAEEEFDFVAQMFIDSKGFLWFESTKIPIVYASDLPLDLTHSNNKIFRVNINDAIKGTICENN
ncbi:L-dopachrome tautomerase yellow-f2-like [Lutzomyia longipalpis]|uniref:L-dopachrome tautomerase yellow-f2-like n=1 Tax=Lutzomyia longipalpis TaxID=7200 RepID=UPI002483411E|nr:L-dopachrome tautomerase yellow-f2-like [Lutzomyia longipalpis]